MFTLEIINFTKQAVPLSTLKAATIFAAKRWRLQGELSVVLAGDRRLQSLNRDFRQLDKVTDVLSFAAPAGAVGALGEIFINLSDCRRPSKYREVLALRPTFNYLLLFLLLHGLLHLAGYDDVLEADRQAMVMKGEKMMKELVKNGIIKEKF